MYRVDENEVFFNNDMIYSSPGEIVSTIPFENRLIIHYDVPPEKIQNVSQEEAYQNVLSIDFNGSVLWRLPLPEKNMLPAFQPDYRNIRLDGKNNFWAGDGAYMNRFDPETGKILERVFTK